MCHILSSSLLHIPRHLGLCFSGVDSDSVRNPTLDKLTSRTITAVPTDVHLSCNYAFSCPFATIYPCTLRFMRLLHELHTPFVYRDILLISSLTLLDCFSFGFMVAWYPRWA